MLCKGGVAFGQADTAYNSVTAGSAIDLHWYDGESVLSVRPIPDLYDTIPCFMLCSDTSFTLDTLSKFPKVITLRRYTYEEIFWLHGYEVREKHNESEGVIDPGFYMGRVYKDYYIHKEYIGYDKKPLSKNVVVWVAK